MVACSWYRVLIMTTKKAASKTADKEQQEQPKKKADWDAVEIDFRAGVLTFEEMAAKHGATKGRISQVAKERGWTRDLSAKIKAKADAKLNKDALNKELNAKQAAREEEVVEANAELQARIRREQRTDISRSRKLVMGLLVELEEQTDNRELYEKLGELMANPDDKGVDKLNELYHKVISLGGRTSTMKSLADSLKTLVALEREAFGIDDRNKEPTGSTVFNLQF